MTRKFLCGIQLFVLTCLGTSAGAFDLGKIMSSEPDDDIRSAVRMFDIERCMIAVDAAATPSVYRQPDEPNKVMIAWATGIVVEMETNSEVTFVKTHFQSPGGRKARKRLLECAGIDRNVNS